MEDRFTYFSFSNYITPTKIYRMDLKALSYEDYWSDRYYDNYYSDYLLSEIRHSIRELFTSVLPPVVLTKKKQYL